MADNTTTWGIVSTIKAPSAEILTFVAYHLDLGASRVIICLDAPAPEADAALKAHPKCEVLHTDRRYWKTTAGFVPKKHQVRQAKNASYIYGLTEDLDWLAHIDVDEFLCPSTSITNLLGTQPDHVNVCRIAPCESLCTDGLTDLAKDTTYCKARPKPWQRGKALEQDLYPEFGGFFKDGFISHTAGKLLVRTGLPNVEFGIHRAFDRDKQQIPDVELEGIELCHRHVESWEKWQKIMAFRLSKGSYRSDLDRHIDPASGRMSKNALFSMLLEDSDKSLRRFFDEVCLATPRLREALNEKGLLRRYQLDLLSKLEKHFPDFVL